MTAVEAVQHDFPGGPPPPPPPPDPPSKGMVQVVLGDHLEDPRPLYDLLAASGRPVAYAPDYGLYLLHEYSDVKRALLGGDGWSNSLTLMPVYQPCEEALAILADLRVPATTAAADNPTHRRTRAALTAVFPHKPEHVAARFGGIVNFRVDQVAAMIAARRRDYRVIDLAAQTAHLPAWVICDILGVPPSDIGQVKAWADGQIALVWGNPEPPEQVRLAQGLLDFWTYTQRLVLDRERHGDAGDDLIARLIAYRAGDDAVLSLPEVASIAFNLLVAGHETTAGLIAHCLDTALTDPGRWQALATDPHAVPDLVEKTLRCRPPIDAWLRLATTDQTFGDVTIPAGSRVLCLIGAANQDPTADPMPFGYGPHFCIGAALARLEATALITELAARVPGLRRKPGASVYLPNVAFRAHQSLPATVG